MFCLYLFLAEERRFEQIAFSAAADFTLCSPTITAACLSTRVALLDFDLLMHALLPILRILLIIS